MPCTPRASVRPAGVAALSTRELGSHRACTVLCSGTASGDAARSKKKEKQEKKSKKEKKEKKSKLEKREKVRAADSTVQY